MVRRQSTPLPEHVQNSELKSQSQGHAWQRFAWIAIFYLLAIRLWYIGASNLIPEEAYYWNYGQHLDWGYLDHPPMVAWLSRLGTTLLGHSEFGVRFFSVLCWFATGAFSYALAKQMYDRATGLMVGVLVSALPFFFTMGMLMVPDAPLTAAWAGALYFLYQALERQRRMAWIGAGLCAGLGLLSKYSCGLLILATLVYLVFDKPSRRWLLTIWPYLAVAIALLVFSPVIYWNSQHDWVSFAFQTTRRVSAPFKFSWHILLGSILVLLSPMGVYAVGALIRRAFRRPFQSDDPTGWRNRRVRFAFCFAGIPLTVFVIFSFSHQPKLNWTGPLWLSALPLCALTGLPKRFWTWTIVGLSVAYTALFYWILVGVPGVGYPSSFAFASGWPQLAEQIDRIETRVEKQTREDPIVVGMDLYFLASEHAFYDRSEGSEESAGRHLVGEASLMYEYWFPTGDQAGKNIVVVSTRARDLNSPEMAGFFDSLGVVETIPIELHGQSLTSYYARVGYGYHAPKR